ncbi:hypothetical protein NtRootA9_38130 [Arthrobacter sp. NtRootA9]|nr:hypothetical protein NtRootA9_38130 [Arthrobacter sp. NtRootA9]
MTMATSSFPNADPGPVPSRIAVLGRRALAIAATARMSRFAAVGAFGTVLNLAIMAFLLGFDVHYLLAAAVAAELTILSNFLMQEHLVFADRRHSRPFWHRFFANFAFNNAEALARVPVLMLLVEVLVIPEVLAQAMTLAAAFLLRFLFASRFIYRAQPTNAARVQVSSPVPVEVEAA